MLRCLIIMHSVGGGAEKVALDLAQRLNPQRVQTTLCCTRHLPSLAGRVPPGIPFCMPERGGLVAALRHMARIRKMARTSDVVLGSLELQSIFWAGLWAPGRAVGWLHKNVEGYLAHKGGCYGRVYRAVLGWVLRRCHSVVCVSLGILESSARLWPDISPRLRLLWNPVDAAAVHQLALAPLSESLNECFRKPVVLGVGRLERQKAFEVLIEAHAILKKRGVEHNLCIAGEGSQRAFLEDLGRHYGVGESLFLPGFLNPYPLMARAAVLASSSVFEGLPLVLVEALCLGLPVVATDCPSGPGELLEQGRYGALTPVGHAAALADALQRVLSRPPDKTAREAGQRRAEDFAPARTVASWQSLLEEAAGQKIF